MGRRHGTAYIGVGEELRGKLWRLLYPDQTPEQVLTEEIRMFEEQERAIAAVPVERIS